MYIYIDSEVENNNNNNNPKATVNNGKRWWCTICNREHRDEKGFRCPEWKVGLEDENEEYGEQRKF